jgi:hypothetical protein
MTAGLVIRPVTRADIREYAGQDIPEWCVQIEGHAAVRGGNVVALGLVVANPDGHLTGWFDAKENLPPVVMHRTARRTLDALRRRGERRIAVICDASRLGSALWLERLGFRPGEIGEFGQVWRCDLST